MKKIIIIILALALFAVPVAEAYLGAAVTFATVLRVGGVYIAQQWRNSAVREVAYSLLGHAALLTAGYLAYDRGTSVPASERYVTVKLTESQTVIQNLKDTGQLSSPSVPAGTWATSVSDVVTRNVRVPGDYVHTYTSVPTGSTAAKMTKNSFGESYYFNGFTSSSVVGYCIDAYTCQYPYSYLAVASSEIKTSYQRASDADKVLDTPALTHEIKTAIGRDLARGDAQKAPSAPAGSVVFSVGGDVYETNNYDDSVNYIQSGAGADAGIEDSQGEGLTKQDVQDAVGGALTEKLGDSALPSDPAFDSGVPGEQPVEENYKNLLTDFFNTHPLRAITQTAKITTSGAVCYVEGVVDGMTLKLSFCELESLLHLLGVAFVLICTVRSFFIAMGVGE